MRISADTMSDFREYLDKIGIDVNTGIIMSNIDLSILYAYRLTNQYSHKLATENGSQRGCSHIQVLANELIGKSSLQLPS